MVIGVGAARRGEGKGSGDVTDIYEGRQVKCRNYERGYSSVTAGRGRQGHQRISSTVDREIGERE